MKRYTLTESNLRNLIRESIKNVLREADENSYGGDGNFRHDYRIGAHGYVTGSVNMPDDKIKDPSNVRWRNPYLGDTDSNRMHKDLEDMNKKERNNMRRADKRWQKSADSRPLHRKGAAQRDLMDDVNEGIVRRMVREAVRNALNEGFNNGNEYMGVIIPQILMKNPDVWKEKIEFVINNDGWPIEKVQRAIDSVAKNYEQMRTEGWSV